MQSAIIDLVDLALLHVKGLSAYSESDGVICQQWHMYAM